MKKVHQVQPMCVIICQFYIVYPCMLHSFRSLHIMPLLCRKNNVYFLFKESLKGKKYLAKNFLYLTAVLVSCPHCSFLLWCCCNSALFWTLPGCISWWPQYWELLVSFSKPSLLYGSIQHRVRITCKNETETNGTLYDCFFYLFLIIFKRNQLTIMSLNSHFS